jgi:hypothetical protein
MAEAADGTAPSIGEFVVGDPPEAWMEAGFTVVDGLAAIGTVRVRLVDRDGGRRIRSWSLRGVPVADGTIDGLPTAVATDVPAEPGDHPNGVVSIDHVVVATPDLPRTVGALEAVGLAARRTRETDSYGAPMRQVFFRLGEVILEVIGAGGDVETEPDAGPAGFFGFAFTVDDLDATKAFFGDLMGHPKPAVQPGRRIATARHKELGVSVALAFMSSGEQEYS